MNLNSSPSQCILRIVVRLSCSSVRVENVKHTVYTKHNMWILMEQHGVMQIVPNGIKQKSMTCRDLQDLMMAHKYDQ